MAKSMAVQKTGPGPQIICKVTTNKYSMAVALIFEHQLHFAVGSLSVV